MTCSHAECKRPATKRKMCATHYELMRRNGLIAVRPKDPDELFWSHVEKTETCWLWTASLSTWGYGYPHRGPGRTRQAHRVAYELLVGPIPDGLHLDHLCRVRRCVNPAHLEPVTAGENLRRGDGWSGVNARKTHCKRGHEFTPENTMKVATGRKCRTCYKAEVLRRSAKVSALRSTQLKEFSCRICGSTFAVPGNTLGPPRKICSDACRRRAAVQATQKSRDKRTS